MKIYRLFAHSLILSSALASAASADRPTGSVVLTPTYNVTPNPVWRAGSNVFLYIDVRPQKGAGFFLHQFPGSYPRTAGQTLSVTVPNVSVGEKILVQGTICAEGSSDCVPSEPGGAPVCAATVHILGQFRPSCQPTFTYTGGAADGGVTCSASCR